MTKGEQVDQRIAELEEQLCNPPQKRVEVYSRIVGYYREINNWNPGKREEYRHRAAFHVPESPKNAHEPSLRPEEAEKRTTFRPDQAGALPIIEGFQQLSLGKNANKDSRVDLNSDWDLGTRQQSATQYEICESCQ